MPTHFNNGREKSTRKPAVQARVRRIKKRSDELPAELENLGWKPVSEWDLEELARGRPKKADGTFGSKAPTWITPAILDEARRRHKTLIADDLRAYSHDALRVMHDLMMDDEVDDKGKPMTSPSVRLDAAKYIVNQAIGLPTAKVEVEANVQLQGLLAAVVVNPDGTPSYPGVDRAALDGEVVDDDDD